SRIRKEIAEARRLAAESGDVPPQRMARLDKMNLLADHTERALKLFVRTARLDVGGAFGVFREGRRALPRKQCTSPGAEYALARRSSHESARRARGGARPALLRLPDRARSSGVRGMANPARLPVLLAARGEGRRGDRGGPRL